MERIDQIWKHPVYQENLRLIGELEKDREFCGHPVEHFLDTARLMYIFSLEEGGGPGKEIIYATALLHDIGRARQMMDGTPHEIASAKLADQILLDCGFDEKTRELICEAILSHREKGRKPSGALAVWLYRADKKSRNCFCCPAEKKCDWAEEKKNKAITY